VQPSARPTPDQTRHVSTGPPEQDTTSQDTWRLVAVAAVVVVGIQILVIVAVELVDRVLLDRIEVAVVDDTSVVVGVVVGIVVVVVVAGRQPGLEVAVVAGTRMEAAAAADIVVVVVVAADSVVAEALLHNSTVVVVDGLEDRPGPATDWVWVGPTQYHDQNDCDHPTSRLPRRPNELPSPADAEPVWKWWAAYSWSNLARRGGRNMDDVRY
jgi:hypothetical protein